MIIYLLPTQNSNYYLKKFEVKNLIDIGIPVEIWDLNKITSDKLDFNRIDLDTGISPKAFRDFSSIWEVLRAISLVKDKKNSLVVNYVFNDSIKAILINFFLKKNNIRYVYFDNDGHIRDAVNSNKSILKKIISLSKKILTGSRAVSIGYIRKRLKVPFIQKLSSALNLRPSFIMVAGAKKLNASKDKYSGSDTKIIAASSWDYSNHLVTKHNLKSNNEELISFHDCIVFIDGAGPKFHGDDKILGLLNHLTSDIWYPALCKFFDFFEEKFQKKIVIAGHPQSFFEPNPKEFGGRDIIYYKTEELIKNSSFVLSRGSTALSYAIFYNKTIVGITSNEFIENRPSVSEHRAKYFKSLDSIIINIDNFSKSINVLLNQNTEAYSNYLNQYISSSRNIPNFELLSEIIRQAPEQ